MADADAEQIKRDHAIAAEGYEQRRYERLMRIVEQQLIDEYDLSHDDAVMLGVTAWRKGRTVAAAWREAERRIDKETERVRPCKSCGEPTVGYWCSTACYRADNPGEDDDLNDWPAQPAESAAESENDDSF